MEPTSSPLILTNLLKWTTLPAGLGPFSSDISLYLALFIWLFASKLCLFQFLFLRSNELSRRQLSASRTYQLAQEQKRIAFATFTPSLRILGNYSFKAILPTLCYLLAASEHPRLVLGGLFGGAVFLAYNVYLGFRDLINPKAKEIRRYMLFHKSPTFAASRIIFNVFRRFVYLAFSLSVITYCLHRLRLCDFGSVTDGSSLFLIHLASNLSGMTSLGVDMLDYHQPLATACMIFRIMLSVALVLQLVNGITHETFQQLNRAPRRTKHFSKNWMMHDVNAAVELAVEQTVQKKIQLSPETSITGLLRSPELLIVCQTFLEQIVEQKWPYLFDKEMTVEQLAQYLYDDLRGVTKSKHERHFNTHKGFWRTARTFLCLSRPVRIMSRN